MAISKYLFVVCICLLISSCITPQFSPQTIQLSTLQHQNVTFEKLYSPHTATVLIWFQTGCSCVKRYQSRMEDLALQLSPQSVAVYAIASNADESSELIQKTAEERQFQLPLLLDKGGHLAKKLQVNTTPTAVVLDTKGQVLFKGWIDNERLSGDPQRVPYLENALHEIIKGEPVKQARPPIYGCLITR